MGEKYIQISTLKTVALTIVFYIFIIPYSHSFNGQDWVSANYLFALFPFVFIALGGRSSLPKFDVILYMVFLTSIFIIYYFYQDNASTNNLRRFASFAVFMSMFSLMFIKISLDMTQAFKYSVIAFSVYTSITVLVGYMYLGGAELGGDAKGLIGSQRIGFVYILALWIILLHKEKKPLYIAIKHILGFIVIIGIFLTFSRTSIIALLGTTFVYYFLFIYEGIKRKKGFYKIILKIFKVSLYIFIINTLISIFLPYTTTFYKNTIYKYTISTTTTSKEIVATSKEIVATSKEIVATSKEIVAVDTSKEIAAKVERLKLTSPDTTHSVVMLHSKIKETSIGYRVYITDLVLSYVFENPLIGSGFQGVWTLFENNQGSAHSQYLDTLFRTGIIGLIIYILFLFKIGKFLFTIDRSMFIGFIGILLYGLFHETFKLSQGAFILSFLFALYNQRLLEKH